MRYTHLVVSSAMVLAIVGAQPVSADTCESPTGCSTGTTTTFQVTAGNLRLTVPNTATLNNGTPGQTVTNGAGVFGAVTVVDARGANPAAWTATVSSTPFVASGTPTVPDIPPSAVTYEPGTASPRSGDGVFTPSTVTLTTSPQTVYAYTGGTGGSSATWNPALTVAIPVTAAAGRTYSGTVTHSVA